MQDLDAFADRVLSYGSELDEDHPGFKDQVYRTRRAQITSLAKKYKHGDSLPFISYTDTEKNTWKTVYNQLTELYPQNACREYLRIFPSLIKHAGYGPDEIPQLADVSAFLEKSTGFVLRPVMGLLSSRDFLNGLALRVFHSTQYVRHHSKPLYTPEPDVAHELLGHVPLFADPAFADFSQEIGIASLQATDEELTKLATIYWFTIEFGICREFIVDYDSCKEGIAYKAYGAGLLSSPGELEHSISEDSRKVPFKAEKVAVTPYVITRYQDRYFYTTSFENMKKDVLEYTKKYFTASRDELFWDRNNREIKKQRLLFGF